MSVPVLELRRVTVALPVHGAAVPVLRGLDLSVSPGEMLALVGESGSGKTTACMAIAGVLPQNARVTGRMLLEGTPLETMPEAAARKLRGERIGIVFQDPLSALNPSLRVGTQIAEALRLHRGASKATAWARAIALLDDMGIAAPALRAHDYPHQFSGGMRQRVLIAAALACDPALLIADEPTSGLDAALAAGILDVLARLRRDRGLAVLLISHDLAQVARYADTVAVIERGVCVEHGAPRAVLAAPHAPATRRLRDAALNALAGPAGEPRPAPAASAWLDVSNLTVRHARRFGEPLREPAVRGVSFTLGRGECLGIVGASGSGKSTLGRAVLQMQPYAGQVRMGGADLAGLRGAAARQARSRLQIVYQEPRTSLNPLMTVAEIIGEALLLSNACLRPERARHVEALLHQVGLPGELARRRPPTLSGGQAQRVAIARALAASPDLILLDEPTASLDVCAQASLLSLLADLARDRALGYILISHDLAVVRRLAHRIAILDRGALVELADAETLLRAPRHPVTAALVAAASG